MEGRRLESMLMVLQDLHPGCLVSVSRGWEIVDRSFRVGVVTRGWQFFFVGHGGLMRGTKFGFEARGGAARGLSGVAWGLSTSDFQVGGHRFFPCQISGVRMGLRRQGWRAGVRLWGTARCRGFGLRGELDEDAE